MSKSPVIKAYFTVRTVFSSPSCVCQTREILIVITREEKKNMLSTKCYLFVKLRPKAQRRIVIAKQIEDIPLP